MEANRRIRRCALGALVFALAGPVALPTHSSVAASSAVIETFPVGTPPWSVLAQGDNIWVTTNGSDNVTKLRASDGVILGTFPADGISFYSAFDGANIWVSHWPANTVSKLRATDGALLGTFVAGDGALG